MGRRINEAYKAHNMKRTLAIDIETFSSVDIKTSGAYKYAQAEDFEVLLFAYAYDDGPVKVVDIASGEKIPAEVKNDLINPEVTKTAFNANFERTCLSVEFMLYLSPEEWDCTMVRAAVLGLPLSLETAARVLELPEQKDVNGKALIRYFSLPCKPTKANGERTRNLPHHDPAKWQLFKNYCIMDVVVERALRKKTAFYKMLPAERKLWALDQTINDRGIVVDLPFVKNAISLDIINRDRLTAEAIELTGLSNPNSAAQLKDWLNAFERWDGEVDTLRKDDIPRLLNGTDCQVTKRVLELRQEMSKTSVKKYTAMLNSLCADGRVKGLLQFYGANRTGRWAGRLIQVQNLPKNQLEDLDAARKLVAANDLELLDLCFGNVPDTLSQLVRTAFVAPDGKRFIVADFSAIEARVLAWLAREGWRLQVFNSHGKIYEASAAQMFKVPLEAVTKGSDLRQKGKMSELALGYQGGPDAIIRIEISNKTPEDKRIPEEELPKLVKIWRNANPGIVKYWRTVNDAAIKAVDTGQKVTIYPGIKFFTENNVLFIELPSGRRLSYYAPHLVDGKYGPALRYWGMDQTTKQWKRIDTYGGKLVENITQAIARDCLAEALLALDDKGYWIVMHVHDEVVLEAPEGWGSCEEVDEIMSRPIPWAKGLPLTADSYETKYYRKD